MKTRNIGNYLVVIFIINLFSVPALAQWFNWEARSGQTQRELQQLAAAMKQRSFQPRGLCATSQPGAAVRYATIWQQEPNTFAWECWLSMSEADYRAKLRAGISTGWTPTDVSAYVANGEVRYAAISTQDYNPSPAIVFTRVAASQLKAVVDSCAALGLTLVDMDGFVHQQQLYYAALFRTFNSGPWVYTFGEAPTAFQTRCDAWTAQGYSPISVNYVEYQGELRCSAVWSRAGVGDWEARRGFTEVEFQQYFDKLVDQGYALAQSQEYLSNGHVLYAGIFRRAPRLAPRAVAPAATGPRVVAGSPPMGSPARRRLLAIAPVQQQTPVWCWLAVGEMLLSHLGLPNRNPGGNYQCGIIGTIAAGTACATNCFLPECLVPSGSNYNTARMLRDYSWLAGGRVLRCAEAQELSFAAIQADIDSGRPILCGISPTRRQYAAGAEHVVLLVGYEQVAGQAFLIINDPYPYASSDNPYFRYNSVALAAHQYKIPLEAFTTGIFWHWSLSNIALG